MFSDYSSASKAVDNLSPDKLQSYSFEPSITTASILVNHSSGSEIN